MSLLLPGYIQRDPDYFVTDFSEYPIGAQPSGWTQRYNTGGYTALVQAVAGSISGKALQWTKSVGNTGLLSWDRVPAKADVELLARFRANEAFGNNEYFLRFGARASGAAGSENFYAGSTAGSTSGSRWSAANVKFVGGAASFVGTATLVPGSNYVFNNWAWQRWRINGTTLQRKNWLDSAAEPAAWDETVTDSAIAAGGWIGIIQVATTANPNMEVDFFSVALNGKTAAKVMR